MCWFIHASKKNSGLFHGCPKPDQEHQELVADLGSRIRYGMIRNPRKGPMVLLPEFRNQIHISVVFIGQIPIVDDLFVISIHCSRKNTTMFAGHIPIQIPISVKS